MKKQFLFLFAILLGRNAYAYLDLGTGSYIIQIVIAALLSGAFIFKSYFARVFYFIKGIFSGKKEDEDIKEDE
jgi:hypothetical protein